MNGMSCLEKQSGLEFPYKDIASPMVLVWLSLKQAVKVVSLDDAPSRDSWSLPS
jgi:hypothetical protein